jgi:hypothetical protein
VFQSEDSCEQDKSSLFLQVRFSTAIQFSDRHRFIYKQDLHSSWMNDLKLFYSVTTQHQYIVINTLFCYMFRFHPTVLRPIFIIWSYTQYVHILFDPILFTQLKAKITQFFLFRLLVGLSVFSVSDVLGGRNIWNFYFSIIWDYVLEVRIYQCVGKSGLQLWLYVSHTSCSVVLIRKKCKNVCHVCLVQSSSKFCWTDFHGICDWGSSLHLFNNFQNFLK